jgi:hypothetical protein
MVKTTFAQLSLLIKATEFKGGGINPYINRQNIIQSISASFPTIWHNAIKFGINHFLIAMMLSSISRINWICKIAAFSGDVLVKALLKLDKVSKQNAISASLAYLVKQSEFINY